MLIFHIKKIQINLLESENESSHKINISNIAKYDSVSNFSDYYSFFQYIVFLNII